VATEIHLIHSRLGLQPRYEVIGNWPLRAAPAPEPASGPSAAEGNPGRPGESVP
jgi:hypothetical protein